MEEPVTCPSCLSYEWSYHSGIDKMKCWDCGYTENCTEEEEE